MLQTNRYVYFFYVQQSILFIKSNDARGRHTWKIRAFPKGQVKEEQYLFVVLVIYVCNRSSYAPGNALKAFTCPEVVKYL